MNRTAFSLPERSDYRTSGGLAISRAVEQFTGNAKRLDDLIELLDRRRGVVLSSGTTVPGRYESFDLGFADPPLQLETAGSTFSLQALNARGEVLIGFLGDALHAPCAVVTEKSATRPAGHILPGAAPHHEEHLRQDPAAGMFRPCAGRISGHCRNRARRIRARRSVRGGARAIVRRTLRALAGGSVPAAVSDQSIALWRADESR